MRTCCAAAAGVARPRFDRMGARLGQHFLIDSAAAEAVAAAVGAGPGRSILEVGPGRGALTMPLLRAGADVVAVELDEAAAAALPGRVPDAGRLRVVREDFLTFDLGSLGPGPWLVAGNLPYAVATPILQKLLLWPAWTRAALMFQKEVALRVAAAPGGADYGLLALSTRLRADAGILLELGPESFRPRPKVDSAVVVLRRLAAPRVPPEEEPAFWRLAKAAFSQRRKMAAGVLAKALRRPKAEIEAALAAAGADPAARPEDIPFECWAALAKKGRGLT
ncbi:MAG: ribosomal RNA small subunit methyltransferase A [Elusimicrobia bacterium]|nr:ribosomal RNA small subunit methyltransferase A [Elusimicrobiota bacterium]